MSWLVTNKRSFFRQQAAMFGLMGLMVIIFGAQLRLPYEVQAHFMAVPADVVESWNLLLEGKPSAGVLWSFITLVTYSFMHASLDHIASNLLFYWVFGALINELLGWRWLLGMVLFTAVGGGVVHTLMNPETWGPMVGASGVVSGFMGAFLGLAVRWQLPNPHIWPIARPIPPANLGYLALVFIIIDYRAIFTGEASMTAFGAHVGGFTAGLFMACFITPRPAAAIQRR